MNDQILALIGMVNIGVASFCFTTAVLNPERDTFSAGINLGLAAANVVAALLCFGVLPA